MNPKMINEIKSDVTSNNGSTKESRNDKTLPKAVVLYDNKLGFIWDMKPEEKFQPSLPEPSLPEPSIPEPSLIRDL